jgi:hypothetical protein
MQEAAEFKMPKQLRILFLTLVLFNDIGSPLDLYNSFKKQMSEDY